MEVLSHRVGLPGSFPRLRVVSKHQRRLTRKRMVNQTSHLLLELTAGPLILQPGHVIVIGRRISSTRRCTQTSVSALFWTATTGAEHRVFSIWYLMPVDWREYVPSLDRQQIECYTRVTTNQHAVVAVIGKCENEILIQLPTQLHYRRLQLLLALTALFQDPCLRVKRLSRFTLLPPTYCKDQHGMASSPTT